MKPDRQATALIDEYLSGRIVRRQLVQRAAALGLGVAALARGSRLARAQQAAAPGGNEAKGPPVEKLTFWTRANPNDPGDPNVYKQLEGVGAAYEAQIGTKVEFVNVPDADFRNRMSIAAPGGKRSSPPVTQTHCSPESASTSRQAS